MSRLTRSSSCHAYLACRAVYRKHRSYVGSSLLPASVKLGNAHVCIVQAAQTGSADPPQAGLLSFVPWARLRRWSPLDARSLCASRHTACLSFDMRSLANRAFLATTTLASLLVLGRAASAAPQVRRPLVHLR
jgi:hypothetical protein